MDKFKKNINESKEKMRKVKDSECDWFVCRSYYVFFLNLWYSYFWKVVGEVL